MEHKYHEISRAGTFSNADLVVYTDTSTHMGTKKMRQVAFSMNLDKRELDIADSWLRWGGVSSRIASPQLTSGPLSSTVS